jgi:hypothetical protein
MSARAHCQLNRRRRIVKADICDRHHLATVRVGDKRRQSALFFNGLLALIARDAIGMAPGMVREDALIAASIMIAGVAGMSSRRRKQ